ncbi:hypothetical protein EH243_01305 [Amphritea opalescens]|uniref:Uncharacterized protein n=1 Tax=Amphritea opalescens TaxID=2490544 RepID=A0A430KWB1_9GAMM|nr:hypothetical protein [Amphritea opalescens]RTE67613.1 hypothetical protein EH243_01305 [Amphritea opalescens]
MGVSHIKLAKRTVNSVLQLSIVGFELQSKTAIELFFMQHQHLYTLVPVDHAEVLVFDMEHPAVKPLVEQYRGLRPIVAVTATEQQFPGFVTLRKPLEGKRLLQAIQQAFDLFSPDKPLDKQPDKPQSLRRSVSSEGEKAFQAYQKRLAAERQAIADYQASSTDHELSVADIRQRFQLNPDDRSSRHALADGNDSPSEAVNLEASANADHPVITPATDIAPESASESTPLSASDTDIEIEYKAEGETPDHQSVDSKPKLTYQMVYECCGNAPDVDLAEPDQRRRVFFKKDSTLLAILLEVVNEGKARSLPVEVVGLPGTLTYLPEPQQFMFDFSDDLWIPLALTRFGYQELTLSVCPDLEVDRASVTVINRDELIWKLALWTSKGRLDRMIDPQRPYQLSGSVDIDRLLPIPHLATMAKLWGRHRLSAIEVIKALKIHQRYVFAFMTAAYALGALE